MTNPNQPDYQYLYRKYRQRYHNLLAGAGQDKTPPPILPIEIFRRSAYNERLLDTLNDHRAEVGETEPITQWRVMPGHQRQVVFLGSEGQLLAKSGVGPVFLNYSFGGPQADTWHRSDRQKVSDSKQTLPR